MSALLMWYGRFTVRPNRLINYIILLLVALSSTGRGIFMAMPRLRASRSDHPVRIIICAVGLVDRPGFGPQQYGELYLIQSKMK
jgi:hypothetical protein